MEQIGFLDLGQTSSRPNSDITGFNQDGREFAVVGVYDGAVLIDITSPETPIILGKISGSNSKFRDIKYWKRHLYIGTEANDGVKVISVDDPDNPDSVYTITDFTSSHNIHIDTTGFLYVVGTSETLEHGILNMVCGPMI